MKNILIIIWFTFFFYGCSQKDMIEVSTNKDGLLAKASSVKFLKFKNDNYDLKGHLQSRFINLNNKNKEKTKEFVISGTIENNVGTRRSKYLKTNYDVCIDRKDENGFCQEYQKYYNYCTSYDYSSSVILGIKNEKEELLDTQEYTSIIYKKTCSDQERYIETSKEIFSKIMSNLSDKIYTHNMPHRIWEKGRR